MKRRLAAILALDTVEYGRHLATDAETTLKALRRAYLDVVTPAVAAHGGQVVKLLGDGALVAFGSAFDAAHCAVRIQNELRAQPPLSAAGRPLAFRAGLHLGDVVEQEGDVFGDAVNIAARLQALAEPGGVFLSREVRDSAGLDTSFPFRDLGPRPLKHVSHPVHVFAVDVQGHPHAARHEALVARQIVRFCRAGDGTRLAHASVGTGPPLVKAANWLNHLELDWLNPLFRHLLAFLAGEHTLHRYDARGNGLSDWSVANMTFEAFVDDLASVIEAAGIERAPLVGLSQGAAIAAAYAARHPEKVSALVLIGGFPQGRERRASPHSTAQAQALQQMMRTSWEDDHPSLRALMADQIAPGALAEEREVFADQMRRATNAENVARIRAAVDRLDVTEMLPAIVAPTLVLHARRDHMHPLEQGRMFAAGITRAELVVLDTDNHVLSEHEPAWAHAQEELRRFLGAHEGTRA